MITILEPSGLSTILVDSQVVFDRDGGLNYEWICKTSGIPNGYLEVLRVNGAPGSFLIVHEEGKLRRLPVNHAATDIFRRGRDTADFIVGPALFVTRPHKLT